MADFHPISQPIGNRKRINQPVARIGNIYNVECLILNVFGYLLSTFMIQVENLNGFTLSTSELQKPVENKGKANTFQPWPLQWYHF